MITNEIVREIMAGGRVKTNGGVRRCAGNQDIVPGGCVTVLNGMIIGWRRRAGAVMAPTLARYYHLADATALKMYYVDTDFIAVVREEDITPPVTGAALLLHAYNDDVEYLVWFVAPAGGYCRCIIQKDGATVADFISALPGVPAEGIANTDVSPWTWTSGTIDGYIDENNELIWAGACWDYWGASIDTICCQYKNGQITAARNFSPLISAQEAATDIIATATELATQYFPAEATSIYVGPQTVYPGTVSYVDLWGMTMAFSVSSAVDIGFHSVNYGSYQGIGSKMTRVTLFLIKENVTQIATRDEGSNNWVYLPTFDEHGWQTGVYGRYYLTPDGYGLMFSYTDISDDCLFASYLDASAYWQKVDKLKSAGIGSGAAETWREYRNVDSMGQDVKYNGENHAVKVETNGVTVLGSQFIDNVYYPHCVVRVDSDGSLTTLPVELFADSGKIATKRFT